MLRFLRPRSQLSTRSQHLLARTLFTQTSSTSAKALTADKLNPRLLEAQYAVRGELVLKSMAMKKDLESGNSTILLFHLNQLLLVTLATHKKSASLPFHFLVKFLHSALVLSFLIMQL